MTGAAGSLLTPDFSPGDGDRGGCFGRYCSHHQYSMEMDTVIEQDAMVPVVTTVLEVDVLEMTVLSSEEMVAAGDLWGAMMPPCRG